MSSSTFIINANAESFTDDDIRDITDIVMVFKDQTTSIEHFYANLNIKIIAITVEPEEELEEEQEEEAEEEAEEE